MKILGRLFKKKQTKLKNISFVRYFMLKDKSMYDYAMKFGYTMQKPIDVFGVGDLTEHKLGIVKELQNRFDEGIKWHELIDISSRMLNITQKKFAKRGIIDICQHLAYLKQEIERINQVEQELLTYMPDADDTAANIDRFSKYKNYSQIRQLAVTFHKLPSEIEKEMRYDEALVELAFQKDLTEFESEKIKAMNRKSK